MQSIRPMMVVDFADMIIWFFPCWFLTQVFSYCCLMKVFSCCFLTKEQLSLPVPDWGLPVVVPERPNPFVPPAPSLHEALASIVS